MWPPSKLVSLSPGFKVALAVAVSPETPATGAPIVDVGVLPEGDGGVRAGAGDLLGDPPEGDPEGVPALGLGAGDPLLWVAK